MSNKKVQPVRGMRDFLPSEVLSRERAIKIILSTYSKYGFTRIETPVLEDLDVLFGSEGGDNEKLVFQTLKRGEKLDLENAKVARELVDYGMRYDLTVPLARYYVTNKEKLPRTFKAIQIGSVWRAERPQKGRFRQFTQCDIDVIGSKAKYIESELIMVTSEALVNLGFNDFIVRINDRRILIGLLNFCGFDEQNHKSILITLDKIDKIGISGVKSELCKYHNNDVAINKLMEIITQQIEERSIDLLPEDMFKFIDISIAEDLKETLTIVKDYSHQKYNIMFDLSLVRGMGYYTGKIFEINYKDYPFSIAGGGRYDEMIGKFSGQKTPACGFSIGFERIMKIMEEESKSVSHKANKLLIIFAPNCSPSYLLGVAANYRQEFDCVCLEEKMKNYSKQISDAYTNGYSKFIFCDNNRESEIRNIEDSL